ncbi:MAG TPA: nucleotidyltransferase family protein [Pyrinomonadaceae bacterium]|nr:nucleotidyltransferase family protein [Pyrinomonadaceae bacterium]
MKSSRSISELFPDAGLFRGAAARPEHELLLLCAHRGNPPNVREQVVELSRSINDWNYLFQLARRHALLPLLYQSVENVDGLPEDFRAKLRDEFRKNATRNTLLAGELVRLARLFEAEGVALLAYKGPALARQAFGDIRLRRFVDLDVIVRRRDAGRAGGLLQSLGFTKPPGLTAAHEEFLLRRQHNLAYTRDGGLMIVELHWEVAPARFAAAAVGEGVWGRAARVELFGTDVPCPSPEDLLLALAVHGTKHLWEKLAWVCDVAALVNSRPGFDWPYVQERAHEARVERMLHLALRLARGLAGAKLPEGLAVATDDKVLTALSEEVTAAMFSGAGPEPIGLIRNLRFNLRARPGLKERLDYLRFVLTPTDGDLAAFRLPAGISFAYYLLRPLRLVLKKEAGH